MSFLEGTNPRDLIRRQRRLQPTQGRALVLTGCPVDRTAEHSRRDLRRRPEHRGRRLHGGAVERRRLLTDRRRHRPGKPGGRSRTLPTLHSLPVSDFHEVASTFHSPGSDPGHRDRRPRDVHRPSPRRRSGLRRDLVVRLHGDRPGVGRRPLGFGSGSGRVLGDLSADKPRASAACGAALRDLAIELLDGP